jgi:hypothetical protein
MSNPVPTAAQIKACWDSFGDKVSINKVTASLKRAKFEISSSSVARAHKRGFTEVSHKPGRKTTSPPIETIKKVTGADAAVEAQEARDNAVNYVKDAFEFGERLKQRLSEPPEPPEEMLAKIIRKELVTRELMVEAIGSCAMITAREKPAEALAQYESLVRSTQAADTPRVVEQPHEPRVVNGNGRMIEHDASEKPMTDFQRHVLEFRAKRNAT